MSFHFVGEVPSSRVSNHEETKRRQISTQVVSAVPRQDDDNPEGDDDEKSRETAPSGRNGAPSGRNAAFSGLNGVLSGLNSAISGFNGALSGRNAALSGFNGALSGLNAALSGRGAAVLGRDAALPRRDEESNNKKKANAKEARTFNMSITTDSSVPFSGFSFRQTTHGRSSMTVTNTGTSTDVEIFNYGFREPRGNVSGNAIEGSWSPRSKPN